MRSKICGAVVTAALALTSMTACTEPAATGSGASASLSWSSFEEGDVCTEERAGTGGIFHAQAYQEGTGLDPVLNQTSQLAGAQIYGTLMRYDRASAKYSPWYAKGIESNEAGDAWTLTLDPAGKYSDGTPLDATAVKTSLGRFLDPSNVNQFSTQTSTIKEIDIVDQWTVVFKLDAPWGTFPWILTQPPGQIVNPNVLGRLSSKELAASPPPEAGAGAFQVKSFTPGDAIELTAKKNWWRGPVCLDGVRITSNADGMTSQQAMAAGQIDSFMTFDAPALLAADKDPNARLLQLEGIGSTYHFNMDRPGMKDPNVRKALAQSVDTTVLNERIWEGIGAPSRALAPPQSPLVPEVKPLDFDETAARELAEKAAATGWDKTFELTINNTPGNVNQGIIQAGMAEQAGITMNRREFQIGEYIQRVRIQKNYEGIMGALYYQDACPWCSFGIWGADSPSNYMNFKDPGLDAALQKLRAANGTAELKAAMTSLQEVWNEVMPAAVNGYLQMGVVVRGDAHGVRLGTGHLDLYLEQAYLG